MIRVALPKGRISNESLELFGKIFNSRFEFEGRELISRYQNFTFLNVRSQDVPTYVEHGSADIGIVGLDVIREKRCDVLELLDLGFGRCKVAIGIKESEEFDWTKPNVKIATKMVNITKEYFAKKAIGVDVVKLYGSIELAPLVGLADAIVDIVETGNTLRENGLKVADTIMESSVYLIANKNSFYEKKSEILSLYGELRKLTNDK